MTKKKIARTSKGRKQPTEKPVDAEIRRAAERSRIKPSQPVPTGLTPEDEAALTKLNGVSGGRTLPAVIALLKALRERKANNDQVSQVLRSTARDFEYVAGHLTPEPETRDSMLRDALEVIEQALCTLQSDGGVEGAALGVALEGLRSAADDFELFMDANGSAAKLDSMAFLRASERARLAIMLAEFRAKHSEWKPAKDESGEHAEQAAGGAS